MKKPIISIALYWLERPTFESILSYFKIILKLFVICLFLSFFILTSFELCFWRIWVNFSVPFLAFKRAFSLKTSVPWTFFKRDGFCSTITGSGDVSSSSSSEIYFYNRSLVNCSASSSILTKSASLYITKSDSGSSRNFRLNTA